MGGKGRKVLGIFGRWKAQSSLFPKGREHFSAPNDTAKSASWTPVPAREPRALPDYLGGRGNRGRGGGNRVASQHFNIRNNSTNLRSPLFPNEGSLADDAMVVVKEPSAIALQSVQVFEI